MDRWACKTVIVCEWLGSTGRLYSSMSSVGKFGTVGIDWLLVDRLSSSLASSRSVGLKV